MDIEYYCEFCGMEIEETDKTDTPEGGEVRHCSEQACLDKVPARVLEVDAVIAKWKTDEAARLQSEYNGLKTELDKPVYNGKSDQEILDHLNDPDNGDEYDDPVLSVDDFNSSQDIAEYNALTDSQKLDLLTLMAGATIDLSHAVTIAKLDGIFPAESASRKAIEALRNKKQLLAVALGLGVARKEHLTRARKI